MDTVRPAACPRANSLCGASLRALTVAGCTALFFAGLTGCKSSSAPAPIITNNAAADPNSPDPAQANMAGATPVNGQPTRVLGQSQSYAPQQQGESYPAGQQAPAPIVQGYNNNSANNEAYTSAQNYGSQNSGSYSNGQGSYNQGYADGEQAEADTAPPSLPVYDQPPAPDPNDLWTPGYWNYVSTGYYWVPGAWVAAPYYGALWTPPYWAWNGGHYRFHRGYWGPHIGYYGGINYGFGYVGFGYYGGYWRGHDFFYNRSVNNVNVTNVRNVYDRTVVVNNVTYNQHSAVRVSYNGGPGGVVAQPRPFELAAEHERHEGALPAQVALRQAAATDRNNFYAQNQGRPVQAAFAHPPSASAPLPANDTGQAFHQPGAAAVSQPFNHPAGPAAGGTFRQPVAGAAQPEHHVGTPAAAQPIYRPEPAQVSRGLDRNDDRGLDRGAANRNVPAVTPGATPGVNRQLAPAQPLNRPSAAATNPASGRPADRTNQPNEFNAHQGGFHNEQPSRQPSPSSASVTNRSSEPHGSQPGGNTGFNHPVPAANSNVSRPAMMPHVESVRPTAVQAPRVQAPHVEAPHPAPAPHVEAPHPAPAAHPGPPPGAPRGEGGGHPR